MVASCDAHTACVASVPHRFSGIDGAERSNGQTTLQLSGTHPAVHFRRPIYATASKNSTHSSHTLFKPNKADQSGNSHIYTKCPTHSLLLCPRHFRLYKVKCFPLVLLRDELEPLRSHLLWRNSLHRPCLRTNMVHTHMGVALQLVK